MRDCIKDLKDLEDIKSGRKFYIEDREYNRIFSSFPSLAKHCRSTGFCTISNTQVTNDILEGVNE